jgi:hypothetical protein
MQPNLILNTDLASRLHSVNSAFRRLRKIGSYRIVSQELNLGTTSPPVIRLDHIDDRLMPHLKHSVDPTDGGRLMGVRIALGS